MDNRRLEETVQMILKRKSVDLNDYLTMSFEADNMGRKDVGSWIRNNPDRFYIWVVAYSAYHSGYLTPEIDEGD